MVEAVLQRPVSEVVFVFARATADAMERSLDDLPSALAEVRLAVGRSVAGGDGPLT